MEQAWVVHASPAIVPAVVSVEVRAEEKRSVVEVVEVMASTAQVVERMAASIFADPRHTAHEVVYAVGAGDGVAAEAAADIDSFEVDLVTGDAWGPALAFVACADAALIHDVRDQVASVLEEFLGGEVHTPWVVVAYRRRHEVEQALGRSWNVAQGLRLVYEEHFLTRAASRAVVGE